MCWLGYSTQKHVAEKDIEVYKIGTIRGTKFVCEFKSFFYKKGVVNKELIIKEETHWSGCIAINEGYHSYERVSIKYDSLSGKTKSIYRGYVLQSYYDGFYDLATFIIPKGSIYYKNILGEIVSSNIIYTGKHLEL